MVKDEVGDRETTLGTLPEEDVNRATKEVLKQEKCIPRHIWFEPVLCINVYVWVSDVCSYLHNDLLITKTKKD